MTLQKWIKDRAIHGYPTFSIEDVRESGMYSSEQIMKNELNRLCSNKTIANVYRGFYVIIPIHYVLRGSVPATYYIDQLMTYLGKPYYVCMLSAAELLGVAHQRPQQFSVMTTYPRRCHVTVFTKGIRAGNWLSISICSVSSSSMVATRDNPPTCCWFCTRSAAVKREFEIRIVPVSVFFIIRASSGNLSR